MTLFPSGAVHPGHIWSLRQECLFYGLFALTFLGQRKRWSSRLLLPLWCLSPVVLALAAGAIGRSFGAITPLDILFNPANLEFGMGMAIGVLWVGHPQPADVVLPVHPWLVIAALTPVAIALAIASGAPDFSVAQAALMGALAAGLLWVAIRAQCPAGPMSDRGRLLGNASYSIYLFHPHVASAMLRVSAGLAHRVPLGLTIALTSMVAIGFGVAMHLYVEKPLVRRVERLLAMTPAIPPLPMRAG